MQISDSDEKSASRTLLLVCFLTLIVALSWAALFQLDEVTTGQGKVIPSSREQLIQSLDSGILEKMYVQEGQTVEKNQPLLRLDDSRSHPIYQEAREKWLALSAQAARLRAEANDRPIEFSKDVLQEPEIAAREQHTFEIRKRTLTDQIAAMKRSLATIDREMTLVSPLVKQKVVSEVDLLRLQRQKADLEGGIAERLNRYLSEAANELVRIESELAQSRENMRARADAFNRSTIVSPMRGIVKNVLVNTIGGVIQAGQNIVEIVPLDEQPIVEAFVKPSEIAFLKPGQAATVKLSAYDYNKYGGLAGVLEHLSPNTMRDESKPRRPGAPPVDLDEAYYRILVRITDPDLSRKGMVMTLLPGMTAMVELRTGQKTVLDYLIGPIKALSEALRER
ncbi:MAG: HlyD family efflux transporter periplasmic adaptor subunit [Burkholderiaceae bacterium]|jgi:adhesin transport system membrane fusion protein|nr:HlyD family efflux transporter periplasmic adaptor subunit [Burkholderiaceae bacterium]